MTDPIFDFSPLVEKYEEGQKECIDRHRGAVEACEKPYGDRYNECVRPYFGRDSRSLTGAERAQIRSCQAPHAEEINKCRKPILQCQKKNAERDIGLLNFFRAVDRYTAIKWRGGVPVNISSSDGEDNRLTVQDMKGIDFNNSGTFDVNDIGMLTGKFGQVNAIRHHLGLEGQFGGRLETDPAFVKKAADYIRSKNPEFYAKAFPNDDAYPIICSDPEFECHDEPIDCTDETVRADPENSIRCYVEAEVAAIEAAEDALSGRETTPVGAQPAQPSSPEVPPLPSQVSKVLDRYREEEWAKPLIPHIESALRRAALTDEVGQAVAAIALRNFLNQYRHSRRSFDEALMIRFAEQKLNEVTSGSDQSYSFSVAVNALMYVVIVQSQQEAADSLEDLNVFYTAKLEEALENVRAIRRGQAQRFAK